jgi:hypothetical protein
MGAPYALSSDLVSAWPAKSLEVAQYIDGQLPLIAMTQNAQTGTTFTLAATDFTKLVTLSNASPVTVTVPLESSVPWVAGTQLRLMNLGAGVVTVVGAGGVTINGSPLTLAQYKEGTLTKTGTNTWTFTGSASAPGMELINSTAMSGSAVSVNGVFTAAYAHYVVTVDAITSASAYVRMRLRVGGADSSSALYDRQGLTGRSTTAGANNTGSDTGTNITMAGGTGELFARIDVYSPQATAQTGILAFAGNKQPEVGLSRAIYLATTSFDGFSLFPDSGTFTSGTVRTYGLRNS